MIVLLRYASRVKDLSQLYHDRPMPLDKEVDWVEHVVRTKGAVHLRSPALQLSWYQKLYLDFIALVLAILLAFILTSRRVLVLAYRRKKQSLKERDARKTSMKYNHLLTSGHSIFHTIICSNADFGNILCMSKPYLSSKRNKINNIYLAIIFNCLYHYYFRWLGIVHRIIFAMRCY